jgi:hypothetical protein
MAKVSLDRRGWEDGDLPDICMKCGGHAPDRVRKTFVRQTVTGLQAKRVALVPMCREHRNHWRTRTLIAWVTFLPTLVISGLVIRAARDMDPDAPSTTAIHATICLALMAASIAVLVIWWRTIRPTEISESLLVLVNVSPKFVEAHESLLAEENSRRHQKIRLDPTARRRWNGPPASGKPGSLRKDRPEDVPPTNDDIRPR